MLTALGRRALTWTRAREPWTNVYGLGRTLLALSTLATLVCNPTTVLFQPSSARAGAVACEGVRAAGGFCLAGEGRLELTRWLLIAVCAAAASGWRPRLTGVLHWYAAASVMMNAVVVDGGDSVAAVVTLLLVPVTLTDGRRWHWDPPPAADAPAARLVALTALTLVRVQVAGIYVHAAVAKFAVDEWDDGTALYYFLTNPYFGAAAWLQPLLRPLLLTGWVVALLTWSVLVVELVLAAGLLASRRHWRWLLIAGLALHGGIMVAQGLVSFGLAMAGALVLYLRPTEQPFATAALARLFRRSPPGAALDAPAAAAIEPAG